MPSTQGCTPCCVTTTTTNVPGVAGATALTTTTASFVIPAVGATVPISVGDTSWLKDYTNVFISDGSKYGTFVVTVGSSTSLTARFVGMVGNGGTVPGDSAVGSTIASGALVVAGVGNLIYPAQLDLLNSYTDNSTGSASATIAAGIGVTNMVFPHTFIGGTAAVEPVTNIVLGYKFKILSWFFVTEVLLVGAAGSRVANMEINSTDVGTVPSTITIPIANAAVGVVTSAGSAVSGANTGGSTDTFSIEIASGGTQFTAGSGTFVIRIQNMDMADTVAAFAADFNRLRTALRHI